jgi:protein involved in polysaccharide export with SLBB domain
LYSVFRRPLLLLAGLLCATSAFWFSNEALPQSLSPTADQLDAFRNMSPDQQQSIVRQISGALGGQGGTGSSLSGLGGLGSFGGSLRQGGQDRDNADSSAFRSSTENTAPESAVPVLKPDDSIIIEIDFQLAPRPQPTASLSAMQNYGAQPGAAGAGGATGQSAQALAAAAGVTPNSAPAATPQAPAGGAGLPDDERSRLNGLIKLIRSKNPYQLSHDGVLYLPGFAGIPLAGLIEDLATLRLKVEPNLANLDVRVTRLPLTKSGTAALKPFGYDLFQRAPSTFAPVTNVPVPADYVVGPGDQFQVQLYGTQSRNFILEVGRDGRVSLPEIGPLNVGGQRFTQAKDLIEARVARQIVGTRASVSMGDTRAIRIFVLGEATRPGSYTISGLGTITSALFAAGGVKPIGSLRNVTLKRQGSIVRTLDLYDMLIRGDTTDDTKLLPGDVIFVPPVGPTVSVEGEVRRPAIYEQKGPMTVAEVIGLAGGLTPEADTVSAMLTRIDAQQHRVVLQVDPSTAAAKTTQVQNGDLLRVTRLRPTLDSGIVVQGHVFTSGNFAYRDGLRLADVIHSVDELQPNADIHYLLIRRELPPDRRVTVLSADLAKALSEPGSAANLQLMPRDRITVFDLESGRDRVIQPVLDELRLQSNLAKPTQVVRVDGRVKVPGAYPLESGMRISDLIRAGGSLQDAAYGSSAELIRFDATSGESRRTDLINVDLAGVLRGDPKADLLLQPFDLLSIKELPQWGGQESVTLRGEVRFPGQYAVKRGETLKSVIQRAGGLTEYAFAEGSVFTREELRKREQEQLDSLAERMQHDLTILALQSVAASSAGAGGGGGAGALSVGQTLLSQLRATKAVGRLVIDLPRALSAKAGSEYDVVLRNGDSLIVPKFQQEVTVIGEVQNATSHLYRTGLTRDDYISLSGGTTRRADHGRIYVVRANGSVVSAEGNHWFSRGDIPINPGDTVVVPLNAEHMPALPLWTAITTIIYNVAIAAAAVHSF